MNLKKLTQAVFEGLPPEYLWAAVDANGKAWAFIKKPVCDDLMFCDGDDAKSENVGVFFDATDWQNSLIERLDVPSVGCTRNPVDMLTAADIDWSKAPEGTTHWHVGEWIRWTGKKDMNLWTLDAWDDGCRWTESAYGWHGTLETFLEDGAIPRPESITDVARSIEAARVEEQKFKVKPCPHGCVAATIEQSERTYPHYFKDVSGVDAIDLYHVARLYDITDPALFHAFKKIACAGKRGNKDQAQDVQEAIDALKRWQELSV